MNNMTIEKTTRDWEKKQRYLLTVETAVAPGQKIRNLKRSERYGYPRKKERLSKYGMGNYLAYQEDFDGELVA